MKIPTRWIMVPAIDREAGIIGDMPAKVSVLCATCAHLKPGLSCEAFPAGIPKSILDGQADHREPFEGDRGIRYRLAEGVIPPAELAE